MYVTIIHVLTYLATILVVRLSTRTDRLVGTDASDGRTSCSAVSIIDWWICTVYVHLSGTSLCDASDGYFMCLVIRETVQSRFVYDRDI